MVTSFSTGEKSTESSLNPLNVLSNKNNHSTSTPSSLNTSIKDTPRTKKSVSDVTNLISKMNMQFGMGVISDGGKAHANDEALDKQLLEEDLKKTYETMQSMMKASAK